MTTTQTCTPTTELERKLATINLSVTRLTLAARHNPAILEVVASSIRDANRALVFAAEIVETQHDAGMHRSGPEVGCERCEEDEAHAINAALDAGVAA